MRACDLKPGDVLFDSHKNILIKIIGIGWVENLMKIRFIEPPSTKEKTTVFRDNIIFKKDYNIKLIQETIDWTNEKAIIKLTNKLKSKNKKKFDYIFNKTSRTLTPP